MAPNLGQSPSRARTRAHPRLQSATLAWLTSAYLNLIFHHQGMWTSMLHYGLRNRPRRTRVRLLVKERRLAAPRQD
ncbi:TPA: hypothetical protein BOS_21214 [Bos taurus]|nr:TPA: hypothetical protein BOS_21214 [Bos taurus]